MLQKQSKKISIQRLYTAKDDSGNHFIEFQVQKGYQVRLMRLYINQQRVKQA